MLKSTNNVACAILACLAITAITSTAAGAVQYGVVGGGIHVQYGPQDTSGNYMGIVSESYDAYSDNGWYDTFPADISTAPNGEEGHVLLALNPYTGEVWTDVPLTHQAYNPSGTYSGHSPGVMISGPSGLPDDPGTPDVDESLVYSDWVSNLIVPSTGYLEDAIYVTAQRIPGVQDNGGTYVTTSPDGGILADPFWFPEPADPIYLSQGQEVVESGGNVFLEEVIGRICAFDWLGWRGGWGSYNGTLGFEMDGIKGWIKFNYSGNRSGVRLTEYYFDLLTVGDFDGDGDVDADDIDMLCDNLGDPAFDLDDDGDADEDDMIFLITNLVELQDGSGRVGTKRGDFNLDGFVDGTDLALMKTAFGQPGQNYADGNANCDAFVDGTDLAILKTNFGFIADPPVPEPATLSLLALGATGLAAKRRRKS
ncbi:hypothetical protein LCGC14_0018520 [marine sediment metagenome]|uniref:Ice-binding protein C-terminal domain-containing protein n=1 Tax=marine sediment metagenome TaxID=412755 RepID=A0A0F9W256_9ZZZZ|nr:PEP-CTERM sorting domain-containing protein [Phycisphaerae bacterium]HDZ44934.1 PEP-CTERM sorting domain-containing protein [Phycisphaerae bacterium]